MTTGSVTNRLSSGMLPVTYRSVPSLWCNEDGLYSYTIPRRVDPQGRRHRDQWATEQVVRNYVLLSYNVTLFCACVCSIKQNFIERKCSTSRLGSSVVLRIFFYSNEKIISRWWWYWVWVISLYLLSYISYIFVVALVHMLPVFEIVTRVIWEDLILTLDPLILILLENTFSNSR